MAASLTVPSLRASGIFFGSSFLPKSPKFPGTGFGSSGTCPKKPSIMSPMAFGGGGGGTGLESKKEGIGNPPLPGSPGISMSRPALMNLTACTAPQSEVTKPLKPNSSRRILESVDSLPQAKVPLMRLYEHMIDDTSARRIAASNGAA